jgi:16S rRNA A1518/A1519 N6-dimethyltransferase RsmA/KsgA/DIM1 with predicted DNA glycosylase/AP lyase activity
MEIMVLLLVVFLLLVGMVNFIWTIIFSVPYVPSNKKFVKQTLEILQKEKVKNVAELGAGDGRVALAIARKGINVDAFEINPYLSLLIRLEKLFFAGKTLNVYNENFEKKEFFNYQAVIMYLIPDVLKRLESKLFSQMPKNSVIISNTFQFKNHKPEKVYDNLYLYRVI